jgi:hypothetical protein
MRGLSKGIPLPPRAKLKVRDNPTADPRAAPPQLRGSRHDRIDEEVAREESYSQCFRSVSVHGAMHTMQSSPKKYILAPWSL